METNQIKTVLMFAVTLANCGAKAAADSSSLSRAVDFLPLVEDLPGLASLDGAALKAQWTGLDTAGREALVADVAKDLNVGAPALNAAADTLIDVGIELAQTLTKGVTAVEAMLAAKA